MVYGLLDRAIPLLLQGCLFWVPRILTYNGIVLFFFHPAHLSIHIIIWRYSPHHFFVPLQNVQNRFLAYRLKHPLSNLNHLLRLADQAIVQSFLLLIGHFLQMCCQFLPHLAIQDSQVMFLHDIPLL